MTETTATITEPAMRIDRLSFAYAADQPIVRDLTATLAPGRLTVLLGPNAAGKTTLLRLMLGQLQPDGGCVMLDDRPIEAHSAASRAGVISYVPQQGQAGFAFTVAQVVAMGRFAVGRDEQAVARALSQCDLVAQKNRPFNELSVGQQQRVMLARALAQAAGGGRIMLLDEPVSAMDLWHVHHVMVLLRDLARQGLAVVTVLHDLNLAAEYADDIWLLDDGRLLAQGPWQTVLTPQLLEPVYRVSLTTLTRPGSDRPMFAVTGAGADVPAGQVQ